MRYKAGSLLAADELDRSSEALLTRLSLKALEGMQSASMYPTCLERPIGFQVELTSQCNMRCKHCYNASGDRAPDDLSPAEWDGVLDQIAGIEPFQFIISGGEPLLLGERLFSIMDRLLNGTTRFVLITNGWLATSRTWSGCADIRITGYRSVSTALFRPRMTSSGG